MADPSIYLNALREALQFGGAALPSEQADRLIAYLRGIGGGGQPAPAPERPAPTESGAAPAAPAPAARPRMPTAAPAPEAPMAPPPVPTPGNQPQSLLDRLRQQTTESLENPGLQAAGDIGAGMLASRSPNFFTMLGAGLQAQRTAERERSQDLRQAAATEAEARYRDATIRLKEAEDAYNRDPSNPQNILRLAQAQQAISMGGYYGAMGAGGGRGQLTPAVLARLRNDARSRAVSALRNNPLATPAEIDALAEQYYQEALIAAGGGGTPAPAAPQQNIPTINPAGRPTR